MCCTKSVSSESRLRNGFRKFSPPNFFIFALLHQNDCFDNLRTRKIEVKKVRGKNVAEGKDGKCDTWVSH